MEKVLLAIDGVTPSQTVFRYTVELCQRLKAELGVLQVIGSNQYAEYVDRVRRGARQAKQFIEDSMVATTFAEVGEQGLAADMVAKARKNLNELLPESERAGVPYHLTLRPGHLTKEIIRYLDENRNVVLAIYDRAQKENLKREGQTGVGKDVPWIMKRHLSVPLVVVRS